MGFSKNFLWGTATSSFQIEGAWNEDGKGPSIWDDLTHERPGFIEDGGTGDTACDHYHRFREDVALMAKMGIRNYRFSISWPRVLPNGTGEVNEAGIRFYSELVDCLLEHGIRPFCTLYHWDLPRAIHEKGAWLNEKMVDWFGEYTALIADRLGDRVKDYFTINEPQCIIGLGYQRPEHAPATPSSVRDIVRMSHILMKCHGRAAMILRERIPGVRVGYAPCANPMIPLTDSKEDFEAARKAYFTVRPDTFIWNAAWFSDPVVLGEYQEDGLKTLGHFLPAGWEKDLELIHQPLDYYGQNIYTSNIVRAADNEWGYEQVPYRIGIERTLMGWAVVPDSLYWGTKFLYDRYRLPVLITENGMSCPDVVVNGKVHDEARISYMDQYIRGLKRAVDEGIDVAGYFYWSFLDNFEWKNGYTQRFGLVHVNYDTQVRTVKESCFHYKEIMETNGACLDQK